MITDALKVKDRPGLIRDRNSKAIISVDESARQNYINQRNIAMQAFEATSKLKGEVDELRSELGDIKRLLQILVDK